MSLANGLSILFILSKNQILALLIFAMVSFVSFTFISALIFKISFLLLTFYHIGNESPVQVQCTILDAWGWCTGKTQRDGMGREEGGGFRMGNTCIPVADSFRYLAKLIQYCKV